MRKQKMPYQYHRYTEAYQYTEKYSASMDTAKDTVPILKTERYDFDNDIQGETYQYQYTAAVHREIQRYIHPERNTVATLIPTVLSWYTEG